MTNAEKWKNIHIIRVYIHFENMSIARPHSKSLKRLSLLKRYVNCTFCLEKENLAEKTIKKQRFDRYGTNLWQLKKKWRIMICIKVLKNYVKNTTSFYLCFVLSAGLKIFFALFYLKIIIFVTSCVILTFCLVEFFMQRRYNHI